MKKICITILLFLLIGCANNKITKELFLDKASFNGYLLEQNKTGYENYTYIKNIYYAVNREDAYDIQFLILENDDYAKKFFDINKQELKNKVDENTYVKSINKSNYAVYHIENDEEYLIVIRSNNYIIYVDAPIDYINEIENFFKDMDIDY